MKKTKRVYFIGDSNVYSATIAQAKQLIDAAVEQKDIQEILVTMKRLKCDAPAVGEGRFGKMFHAYWIYQFESKYDTLEIQKEINELISA